MRMGIFNHYTCVAIKRNHSLTRGLTFYSKFRHILSLLQDYPFTFFCDYPSQKPDAIPEKNINFVPTDNRGWCQKCINRVRQGISLRSRHRNFIHVYHLSQKHFDFEDNIYCSLLKYLLVHPFLDLYISITW